MPSLETRLGPLAMKTPVATASGTFGYGYEYAGAMDYTKLGAVTAKGVCLEPWPGNPMPRHFEAPGGLVNAIGLQGIGVERFLDVSVPFFRQTAAENGAPDLKLIANVWGKSIDEYAETAKRLGDAVDAVEMNVSCPNVKAGGHTFGSDPAILAETVSAVRAATRLPLIVKLAPNVPSIAPYAKAAEDSGADAISLVNTFPAMAIDIERREPVLANISGGLSGRCIHAAAVKLVWDAHRSCSLPILAMGGICDAKDAIEFLAAGASAVAVGTATFTDPGTAAAVCDGIADYCERHGFGSVAEIAIPLH